MYKILILTLTLVTTLAQLEIRRGGGSGGGGENQTPWLSDINAAGFDLLNSGNVQTYSDTGVDLYIDAPVNATGRVLPVLTGSTNFVVSFSTNEVVELDLNEAGQIHFTPPTSGSRDKQVIIRVDSDAIGNTILITNAATILGGSPLRPPEGLSTIYATWVGTHGLYIEPSWLVQSIETIQLSFPHRVDGTGATLLTTGTDDTFGLAQFSGTAATNANWAEFRFIVPRDLNTNTTMTMLLKDRLGAADTAARTYTVGVASVADSSSVASPTFGNYVAISMSADGSGASADAATAAETTLTGWNTALTPGQLCVIRFARAGAVDGSTAASIGPWIELSYGALRRTAR